MKTQQQRKGKESEKNEKWDKVKDKGKGQKGRNGKENSQLNSNI